MEVKTKLDINQECVFLKGLEIKPAKISKIDIKVSNNGTPNPTTHIVYSLVDKNGSPFREVKEDEVFANKEDLIKALH